MSIDFIDFNETQKILNILFGCAPLSITLEKTLPPPSFKHYVGHMGQFKTSQCEASELSNSTELKLGPNISRTTTSRTTLPPLGRSGLNRPKTSTICPIYYLSQWTKDSDEIT